MARVDVVRAAKYDLADIASYIAADNPTAARRLLDRFSAVFMRLARMPRLGERHPHRRVELRRFTAAGYVIVYREIEGGVVVLRVFHAARDWQSLLDAIDDVE